MEENENVGSQIFWEVLGESAPSLIVNAADLLLSLATLAFMVIGASRLFKSARPGGTPMLIGFAAGVGSAIMQFAYTALSDEPNELIGGLLSLCLSASGALWGYGFLRLSGFLWHTSEPVAANSPSEK